MKKLSVTLFFLLSGFLAISQTHDLTQGLVAYLPLDGSILDQSSLSHQVIVHYGPTHAPDRNAVANNALEFNGTVQALEIDYASTNANALEFGNADFAIGFWVKKLSSTSNWDNTAAISKWNSGAYAGTNEWSFGIGGGGGANSDQPQFTVAMADNNNYSVKSFNNDIVIGQWTHLMAVREGSDLSLYMDGVLQNTTNIGTGAVNDAQRDLLIARSFSGSYFSHAVFDDIVIYNKALSASEIAELMVYGVTTGGQGSGLPSSGLWSSDTNSNIFYKSGKVSVGVEYNNSGYEFAVKGKILAEGVKVQGFANWPDYVFASSFKLRPLAEVASFIKANQHLPEVPSAKEIETAGLDLGAMDAVLLKKVEELTLYTIDQEKRIEKQNELINDLLKRLDKLEKKD
ncbi:LamG domain-containing protein [Roseivirga sp. E12]|uniref:LamG domain-containing protein n=1 Tax=Roseivirga sp. E12 TaxID=2819237 RepID=UPI001ABC207F|nr:LamG domain-containing protein [Roseivirga sp. E12]MBO3700161.1 LamG domain-containing protein [Roseivirga sp. E12]